MSAPSVAEPDRVVALEAVHNFRDLGGYRAADGRTTRWRTLFRADGLHKLTPADLDVLRPVGLRTVIDLRTEGELERWGRFPVEEHHVHFHHVSVIDLTWTEGGGPDQALPVVEFLTEAYLDMLEQGGVQFGRALRLLAQPGALPAVFHCAAGKDRTGLVAALVLGALGVDPDVVAADYGLTAAAMERMRRWAESARPEWVEQMRSQPAAYVAAEPEAMHRVVSRLVAEHGSVREYVRSLGVTEAEVRDLADAVLG